METLTLANSRMLNWFFLHCKAMEDKIKENNIKSVNLPLDFCSKHFLSKGILTYPPLKNLHHITSKIDRDKSIQEFVLKKIDVKMKAIKNVCKSLGETLNDRVIIFSIVSFLPSLFFFWIFVFSLLESGKHDDDLHPLPDKIVIKPAVCGHCSQGLCILSKGKSGKWHAELKPELPIPNGTLATLQHFAPKLLSEEIRVFSREKEKQKHPHQSSTG